jgi:hypothetical protein
VGKLATKLRLRYHDPAKKRLDRLFSLFFTINSSFEITQFPIHEKKVGNQPGENYQHDRYHDIDLPVAPEPVSHFNLLGRDWQGN